MKAVMVAENCIFFFRNAGAPWPLHQVILMATHQILMVAENCIAKLQCLCRLGRYLGLCKVECQKVC
jgi:hypothetical protein